MKSRRGSWGSPLCFSLCSSSPRPLGYTAPIEGLKIAPAELAWARWALLFVVVPGCPACKETTGRLAQNKDVTAGVRLLLVAPWPTEELRSLLPIPDYRFWWAKVGGWARVWA